MTKERYCTYLGTNGTITSPVHLEDIYYVRLLRLMADSDKVLTNGERVCRMVTIPEADLDKWQEVNRTDLNK